MNISSKEKRQVGIFLVIWALIAIIGVVFFWGQNPERLLRGVTTHDEISQLRIDVHDQLFPQAVAALNGKVEGEMPEQLGGIPVDQDVRDGWDQTLEQIQRQVNLSTNDQLDADTGTAETEGTYSLSSTQDPTSLFKKAANNNIAVDTCGYFDYSYVAYPEPESTGTDAQSSAAPDSSTDSWQGATSAMVCLDAVIDRETRSITDVRIGDSW